MTAKRTDANQTEIVKAFRERGLSVAILSEVGKGFPDLAVGTNGMTFLIEIKDGKKALSAQRLTPAEQKFFDSWHGHVEIVRSIADVEKFVDMLKHRFHWYAS